MASNVETEMRKALKGTALDRIIDQLVPEWIEHQRMKAKDYNESLVPGVENADVLGERGQYAELWRKMAKLKKALWDGQKLVGEQPREVLLDFIGHCFLAIDMLDRKSAEVKLIEIELRRSMILKDVVGHAYDGCPICVRAREENPGLIV